MSGLPFPLEPLQRATVLACECVVLLFMLQVLRLELWPFPNVSLKLSDCQQVPCQRFHRPFPEMMLACICYTGRLVAISQKHGRCNRPNK